MSSNGFSRTESSFSFPELPSVAVFISQGGVGLQDELHFFTPGAIVTLIQKLENVSVLNLGVLSFGYLVAGRKKVGSYRAPAMPKSLHGVLRTQFQSLTRVLLIDVCLCG